MSVRAQSSSMLSECGADEVVSINPVRSESVSVSTWTLTRTRWPQLVIAVEESLVPVGLGTLLAQQVLSPVSAPTGPVAADGDEDDLAEELRWNPALLRSASWASGAFSREGTTDGTSLSFVLRADSAFRAMPPRRNCLASPPQECPRRATRTRRQSLPGPQEASSAAPSVASPVTEQPFPRRCTTLAPRSLRRGCCSSSSLV
eukprot:RCo000924